MKYLLLSLFVLSTAALAEGKKTLASPTKSTMSKAKADSGAKTMDLEPQSKKDEVADDTALLMKPKDVKVKFSCKAKDGHEIKQGEKGYDDCLKKVKEDNAHDPNADIKVKFEK